MFHTNNGVNSEITKLVKPSLSQRDRQLIWHPFTQEKTAALPIAIERAQGAYLFDAQGKSYLDLLSSWWVNLHGHAHPAIAQAIYQQALQLEHVMFAGFTHKPAVELCEQLQSILPKQLNRFFFSDNGSTAVEAALKIAFQYEKNRDANTSKRIFLSFEGAYHGDTFGAMSVGATSGFHDPFKPLFFEVKTIAYPNTWLGDDTFLEREKAAIEQLKQTLSTFKNQIVALIVEPLMLGASGMNMCRPEFLAQLVELVKAEGVLVIFDEVMTGFGRTGHYFALEHITHIREDLCPDLICLSKGLTGGFLPMAMTVVSDSVYQAFWSDHDHHAFLHGHSYTANPLGCAAANASFHLLRSEQTQQQIQIITQTHQQQLAQLLQNPNISKLISAPRSLGTIAAFDLSHAVFDATRRKQFVAACTQAGLLIRPLGRFGQSVYLIPPYCITQAELENAYQILSELILTIAT